MFSHDRLWAAIDALAERNSLSPSGLARKAGLDPTAFNKSKRFAADGRPRWPSTESLAKIMAATGTSLPQFSQLLSADLPAEQGLQAVPAPDPVLQPGDRVVVSCRNGEILPRILIGQSEAGIELQNFDQSGENHTLAAADVLWLAKIIWINQ